MEGVGIYWCLIEMLREAKEYELPLSSLEDIAYDIDCDENALNCVLRNFDLFTISETHFSSARLTRSMVEYESLTEKRRLAGALGGKASVKQRLNNGKAPVNDSSSIKGNKSKEKEKKENNPPIDPPEGDGNQSPGDSQQQAPEWLLPFEQFWEAYGKKVDRSKCERKFKNLSVAERERMLKHVPEYVASTPYTQYRKDPLTYLNGRCWNDEALPGGKPNQLLKSPQAARTGLWAKACKTIMLPAGPFLVYENEILPDKPLTPREYEQLNRGEIPFSNYDREVPR